MLEAAEFGGELFEGVAVAGCGGVLGNGEGFGDLGKGEAAPGFHDDDFAEFLAEVLDGLPDEEGFFVFFEERVEPDVLKIVEVDGGFLAFFAAGLAAVEIEPAEADGGEGEGEIGRFATLVGLVVPKANDGFLNEVLGVMAGIAPATCEKQETRAMLAQPLLPNVRR